MLSRRLLYLLLLAAAFVFFAFHTRYFSFMLLLIVLCFPVISLLASLPWALGLRMSLQGPGDTLRRGEEARFTLHFPQGPVTRVKFVLRWENRFTGEVGTQRVRVRPGAPLPDMPFKAGGCGVVAFTTAHPSMLDFTGLFYLPTRKAPVVKVLVLPNETPFPALPPALYADEDPRVPATASARTTADSEMDGVRPFRQGDSLRDIHWKLTARRNEPVVREYLITNATTAYVGFPFAGTPQRVDAAVSRLLGLLGHLRAAQQRFVLLWAGQDGAVTELVAPTAAQVEALLQAALGAPPPADEAGPTTALLLHSTEADRRTLVVGAQGVALYEGTELTGLLEGQTPAGPGEVYL